MVKKDMPNEIVDDPGLTQDSYALLRQAASMQKMKDGTSVPPAVAANNSKIADNKVQAEALKPVKYSIHGIPEGLDHAAEEERLRGLIQGQTATANDIDNYITLSIARQNASTAMEGMSADAGGSQGAAIPESAPGAEPGSAGHAPARQSGRPSAPAGGGRSRMSASIPASTARRGSAVGPRGVADAGGTGAPPVSQASPPPAVQRPGGAGGGKGAPPKAVDSKPAAKASVGNNGITTGPTRAQEVLGRDRMAPLSKQDLRNPDGSPKDPRRAHAEHVVRERELRKLSPEDQALMREYSGAQDPEAARIAAAWEDSGANEVNLPKIVRTGGGFAANELLMGQALRGVKNAGTAASEGITRTGQRMGAGMETARAMANRQAAPQTVNNNISRAPKPPGLQVMGVNAEEGIPSSGFARTQPNTRPGHAPQRPGAAQASLLNAEMADQQAAQAAQARATRKPAPPSATAATHRASEYLEARDSGKLNQPKITVRNPAMKLQAPEGPRFNAMQEQTTPRPRPQRTEGYSVNTQTDAAVKRNSMTKSQRAATANKAAAAEVATEKKAAASKPKKAATTTKKPARGSLRGGSK